MQRKFTALLHDLFIYSDKLDNQKLTHNNFIAFQRIKITEAYQNNELTQEEYNALIIIYHELKKRIRHYLKLNYYQS